MGEDRELLEKAARAAGMHAIEWVDPDVLITSKGGWVQFCGYGAVSIWNPLTDDGDAFRLACDLGLRVYPVCRTVSGEACSAVGSATGERLAEIADQSIDTRAATRRAITRAAAALGDQKEKS